MGPVDCEKKAYLDDKQVVLDNLKRVCYVDSPGGNCRGVLETATEDRRSVLFKDELSDGCPVLRQTSPV